MPRYLNETKVVTNLLRADVESSIKRDQGLSRNEKSPSSITSYIQGLPRYVYCFVPARHEVKRLKVNRDKSHKQLRVDTCLTIA